MARKFTTPIEAVGGSPVESVLATVSSFDGSEPTDLPRLNEVVDPDAVNAFIRSSQESRGTVSFVYAGYEVFIDENRKITVVEPP